MSSLKSSIVLVIVFATLQLNAQDFPYHYFSQFNPMAANPSLAAIDGATKAEITSYNLWASGYKPVSNSMVSFSMVPNFRRGSRISRNRPWVGIGTSFINEKTGPFNQYIFQATYAYHIPLSGESQLSFGISGLVENMNIGIHSLTPLQDGDPRLLNGNNTSFMVDGGFGATFSGQDFKLSFSALNLMPGTFQFNDTPAVGIKSYRKLFLAGSYTFMLFNDISIQPDFTLRNSMQKTVNIDASLKLDLHYFTFGMGYRSVKSLFVFAQIPFNDFLFSYSSENPLQAIHMFGKGHTFSVGWKVKKLR